MVEPIQLDVANLLSDRVGDHGLAGLEEIDARIPALRERLAREHEAGLHGYLALPEDAAMLESVLRVTQPRLGRFRHLVVLGIGGSSLGLRALAHALAPQADLHVVDNTDPALFARTLSRVSLEQTLFVAVSKSGGTLETVLALGFFVEKLRGAGLGLSDHMLIVTDPETGPLRAFADKHGIHACDIPPAVGGRFSVLTPAGLGPAALLNVDVAALLEGAARAVHANWPARLGLISAELCARGKTQLVFMPYSSRLQWLSHWFVQLWDESLGKELDIKGRSVSAGQTAIPAVGATDQHAQLQLFLEGPNDKLLLFTRIERHEQDLPVGDFEWEAFSAGFVRGKTLGQVINAQQRGTAEACAQRQRPNATLILPRLDASTLGELMMGLQIATTFAAYALNVNAYDQPSVELAKRISRDMLSGG